MKKIYTLAALAAMALGANAQIANVDMTPDLIPGKYMLAADCSPTIIAEGANFNADAIVVVDWNGTTGFSMENFFYDKQNASTYESEAYPGTWYGKGEWASYPGVTNIQFVWDNANTDIYDPFSIDDSYAWYWHPANSLRLLPKQKADGTTVLYLWPNNELTWNETNGNTAAVTFPKTGAYNAETNAEGSFRMERLPQYTTVTKRGIAGVWTVKGNDYDGNDVAFPINVTLDGTNIVMTGFFGDQTPVTFTWDDTNAGIRANIVSVTEGSGDDTVYTYLLQSESVTGKIYVSFTEEGNLSFDQPLYYYNAEVDAENATVLYDVVATPGAEEGIASLTTNLSTRTYNLAGQRANGNVRGLVIENGNKVVK